MTEKELFDGNSNNASFQETLRMYLKYWYLFLIGIILCFSGAYLYLQYSTPIYNVSSTIQLKGNEKNKSSETTPIGGLDEVSSSFIIDDEVDILKSKSLMQRVLTELDLQNSYHLVGKLTSKEFYGDDLPLKIIFSNVDSAAFAKADPLLIHIRSEKDINLEDKNGNLTSSTIGQEMQEPYGTFQIVAGPRISDFIDRKIRIDFHSIRELASDYSHALQVDISNKQNKEAKNVNLSLTESVPEKAKEIINKLIELYNIEAIEDKNLTATNTIQFIDDRLRLLTSELSDVEKGVEQYKQQNEVTNISSQASLYLENSSDYRRQLSQLEIELEVLASIENLLDKSAQNNIFDIVPGSLSIQDPTLLSLIAKYNESLLERERMLRTVQPNNPLVLNLTEQLFSHRRNIFESITNTKAQLSITHRNLQESSGRFASQIQKVPQIERELLEVMRQQGIKQELYLYLLQKREESALSLAASTVSSARVIDAAMADAIPTSPKKRSVYMLAFLLGIGLPATIVYMKNKNNDQIQQQNDVINATNTPVLGEIIHNDTNEVIVISEESKTPIAELFRLIRTNLQFRTAGRENKVILVTSSMSGEGKTFFAINLGASLALTGKKVLLMDFDFRMPSLLTDLDMVNSIGITDYLTSEDVSLVEIVKPFSLVPNLFVIGSGFIPKNPAEMVMNPKLEPLLADLEEQYDYIIMDTAPVGQVADAFSLRPYADLMLYLVRYNYTSRPQLNIIDDIYVNKKFNHSMIVLNDADKSKAHNYGYPYGKKKNYVIS